MRSESEERDFPRTVLEKVFQQCKDYGMSAESVMVNVMSVLPSIFPDDRVDMLHVKDRQR